MGTGPLLPGGRYEFEVSAMRGQSLSFATMFVQSNDLFFAPDDKEIPLFDDNDDPIDGDVTDMIRLWDVGTEVNEFPGVGPHQPLRQTGPNTGDDEMMPVAQVSDMFYYPPVESLIHVTISAR
jgi:hypothetical protein